MVVVVGVSDDRNANVLYHTISEPLTLRSTVWGKRELTVSSHKLPQFEPTAGFQEMS